MPMDVTTLLHNDHQKVEQMFQQYEQQHDPKLCEQICMELEVHTMVEEELVYPRLANIDQPLEQHSEQEHNQAKQLIQQIRAMQGGMVEGLMQQLQQAVMHHVQEEESKAFPEMRQRMDGELEQLGEQVMQRKQELMTSMKR